MGDDIGWDDVGFHGSLDMITPNLDTLAADGIRLHNYYSSPLCTPSRTAFLSGVHPVRSGEQHHILLNGEPRGFSLEFPLLPEYLKSGANYSTHLLGKWNLGFYQQVYTPTYRGFDSFFGFYGAKIDYFSHNAESFGMRGHDLRHNLIPVTNAKGNFSTHLFTQQALRLIERHDTKRPLYLHVAYPNTHTGSVDGPLQAPADDIRRFSFLPDRKRQVYGANLFTMDESIGEIFKALEKSDLLENSIVLFVSDNGGGDRGTVPNHGSNRPLRGVKGTLWEGAIRVPALVWSPLFDTSRTHEALFHVSDWLPTLLEAAGCDVPKDEFIYGRSQWQSLLYRKESPRKDILHNIDPIEKMEALRMGDFKLMRGFVRPAVSGWYGERWTGDVKRTRALREVSRVRYVLNLMARQISFDALDDELSFLRCEPASFSSFNRSNSDVSLFNIRLDPCEQFNLADSNPRKVLELGRVLDDFSRKATPPRNLPLDPLADPLFYEETWISWQDNLLFYGFSSDCVTLRCPRLVVYLLCSLFVLFCSRTS